MEHHPIPQDITGFQFKLIGDMTVKQFAYLAAGAILAVIVFYAPLFFLIKLPLVFLCAGFGAALAFLPVEGRPLDVMLSYYIRALFAPTQYVYQKRGQAAQPQTHVMQQQAPAQQFTPAPQPQMQPIAPSPMPQQPPQQPLEDFLASIHEQNKQAIAVAQTSQQPQVQAQTIQAPVVPRVETPSPSPVMIQQQVQPESKYDTGNTYSYASHGAQIISMHGDEPKKQTPPQVRDLQDEPEQVTVQKQENTIDDRERERLKAEKEAAEAKLKEQQAQILDTSKAAHERTQSLEEKFQEMANQKTRLEQELMNLKKQLESTRQQVHTVAPAGTADQKPTDTPKPVSQQVRQIPTSQTKTVGLPQVNDPNIIAGVVKDPRGNVLPNILVEILDSQNNPVRAFKTSQLGQFLSATQLPNGTYKMTFEDPKGLQTFDVIEITAKGDLLLPLEIVSHDAREALRQELFS